MNKSPDVLQAEAILRGQAAQSQEILELANILLNTEKRFGLARKLLALACTLPTSDQTLKKKLWQKHALCTYKDPDLPADTRLDDALEILENNDLATSSDQETLGLAGAIFKRKWELDAQRDNLEKSLSYYLRGYELGAEKDQGFTGINAAFVLDQLASLEVSKTGSAGVEADVAEERRNQAREIRLNLIRKVPQLSKMPGNEWLVSEWWFYATVAEAYFGLRKYDEALYWLQEGKKNSHVPAWELQSTGTQLANLARLHNGAESTEEFEQSQAFAVLKRFLGDDTTAALTAYVGKVGLALSGGGFRASFFHIGVLAKLAELDVLRHVEVLSCVSGGAILGTQYYLELRKLLQTTPDAEIRSKDYVELVHKIKRDFLKGVQKNIRTRIIAEFITNLRMIFWPGYSRTMRAGELFERELFSKVQDGSAEIAPWWAPWRRHRRWLTDLYIIPDGEEPDFRPRDDNWRRKHKVPELILNATTLNTGHNWQFTASWMGEPPNSVNTDVDGNHRLRRMYYHEAPGSYKKFRLGYAVAASASVPGLFEPLSLRDLYPGKIVRLVDGGVHDNQGIVGLLAQDCNVILVSDASGQMGTDSKPGTGALAVPLRSNNILMSRVRAEQYDLIEMRSRSNLVRGRMFIHLKQELREDPVDWIDCEDPHAASDLARYSSWQGVLTQYGIRRDVQEKLAAIRTDLDSFTEAEAFALMTSGYRLTEYSFENDPALQNIPTQKNVNTEWEFLNIEPAMKSVEKSKPLMELLNVANQRLFRVWKLSWPLRILKWILIGAALAAVIWAVIVFWELPLLRVKTLATAALALIAGAGIGKLVLRVALFRDTLTQIAIGVGLAIAGPLLIRPYLAIFNRIYLKLGKVERILARAKKT